MPSAPGRTACAQGGYSEGLLRPKKGKAGPQTRNARHNPRRTRQRGWGARQRSRDARDDRRARSPAGPRDRCEASPKPPVRLAPEWTDAVMPGDSRAERACDQSCSFLARTAGDGIPDTRFISPGADDRRDRFVRSSPATLGKGMGLVLSARLASATGPA